MSVTSQKHLTNGIKPIKLEYNNSTSFEVILENEDSELETASHSGERGIYPMKGIKIDKGFYTVYELKRKYDKKPSLVVLDSDFQRKDVWKLNQKQELIESVLMGLPLPIFYLNQDKAGRLIVIDGRQRLTALFDFIDKEKGFSLGNLKILPELNGKKFGNLDPSLQSLIEDYQIFAHVIQPPTPDEIKFDIFDRVNRAGTQLNKQEIRNALYQGKATILLNRICKTENFRRATDDAFINDTRMKDRLLVLRFIAFYLCFNKKLYFIEKQENGKQEKKPYKYSAKVDEMLGYTMELLNNSSDEEIEQFFSLTITALNNISYYLDENAFRLIDIQDEGKIKRYPVNINIFEILMFGMTLLENIDINHKSVIKGNAKKILDDMKLSKEFRDSLNNHRDSELKVNYRYNLIGEVCNNIKSMFTKEIHS